MSKIKQLADAYIRAAHAVQSGIAMLTNYPDYEAIQPKHMRTGIDMTKADMKGLAELLISKGVFTEEEYVQAIVKSAEDEKAMFEQELSEKLGTKVTLA